MRTMRSNFVIFSDLDGTLLSHDTYSFKAALPALKFLNAREIPIILCSSKTSSEIHFYRKLLQNNDPFISENGGGIFIPKDFFSHHFSHDKESKDYKVIELGTPYNILVETINSIKRETGINIKGFSDMTVEEVSTLTGLNPELAKLAKEREYDEPFLIFGDEADKERIKVEISKRGFKYTEGGRFHHIMGRNDKGEALKTLSRIFNATSPEIRTVAIGNNLNDLPMLLAADTPIVVCKPDGKPDPRINLPNLIMADGIGPEGWNRAVFNLLKDEH